MAPFVIRRLIGMVAVLFGVSVLVYVVFILVPGGDPAERMAGKNPLPANILNIRKRWGFDQPFYVQYVKMMQKAGNGLIGKHGEYDILTSFQNRQNVVHEIKRGIPATFSLCIGAGIIWLLFGILVGFFSAVTAGRWSDRLITTFALIGVSMPVAWLDAMNEEYVRTAKAKGLTRRRVLLRHVLRNSLIPIVSLFGLDFAAVLGGGAILTETVFDLKGVGWYAAQSVGDLDLPPIMGVTLYGAFFIVVFSAVVDFVYAFLDPRIRPT